MGMLSLAIWTPIAFGIVLLALGRDEQAQSVRWLALVGAIVSFLVTLPLYAGFKLDTAEMQFVEKASWIERFNVNYHLGLDGIFVARHSDGIHQCGCDHCGLGSHYPQSEPIHGRFLNPVWLDDWRVLSLRRLVVLRVL